MGASSLFGVVGGCDWHDTGLSFPRSWGIPNPQQAFVRWAMQRNHGLVWSGECSSGLLWRATQVLKRLQNPSLYKTVIYRKRKQGKCQSSDLGTKESRVISKNGFDVSTRTFRLCCLQSRSLPGKGKQQGQAHKWKPHIQTGKEHCKDWATIGYTSCLSLFLQNLIASETWKNPIGWAGLCPI